MPVAGGEAESEASPTGTDAPQGAFLEVYSSLTGRRWQMRPAGPDQVRTLMRAEGLSEPLARALVSRGVTPATVRDFLDPTLKALFPDPSSFADMDRAAALLVEAVEDGRPTVVFADYDVDGATSAALLVRWFRQMGRTLGIYVPDREREGYGPTPAVFRKLKDQGAALVITVDCGAAAEIALATAAEIALPVVVIDHHMMRATPPPAAALVNPNRADCRSGQGNLAAAGVVFVLLAALNREARRRGLFDAGRPEPDLRQWLDLAALGAVCDVTRLTGFNRALTAQGLKVLSSWRNPGLRALADVAVTGGEATTFHAGFVLGPRINAGGRIGRADVGARLLSTDDPEEARGLAAELDAFNEQRKEIEADTLAEAERQLARADGPVLIAAGEGWRPGVVGIVAGRLRERHRRPVIVIGIDPETGIGKGSGRSQPGVNLGRGIQAAYDAGLLLAGGGHAMAAGLTIEAGRIDELRRFLTTTLGDESARATEADCVEIDALLTPGSADRALWTDFNRLAPFGPGNPEGVFAFADVRPLRPMAMKGGHVRCDLVDLRGARLKAVAWRAAETELGRRLLGGESSLHVVGRLKPDDWQGRESVQLEIEDAADPRQR